MRVTMPWDSEENAHFPVLCTSFPFGQEEPVPSSYGSAETGRKDIQGANAL